ncbi:hypothetical protein [Sorangium sp. So ce233]|uniref:hypothetical protein n=1 Tax=Sorangium sp. So ce233 TaxID=3133290 RepID=UPI003F601244
MKRPRVSVPTFRLFERLLDGPPVYIAPPSRCPDCRGKDREHERWCPRARGVQVGARHIGSVHEAAPGEP